MLTIGNLGNVFRAVMQGIGSAFGIGKGDAHESVSKVINNANGLHISVTPVTIQVQSEVIKSGPVKISDLIGVATPIEKIALEFNMRLNEVIAANPKLARGAGKVLDAVYELCDKYEANVDSLISADELTGKLNKILYDVAEITNNPFVPDGEKGSILRKVERDLNLLMMPYLTPVEQQQKQDHFFVQDKVEAFKAAFQQFNGFDGHIKDIQSSANNLLSVYRLTGEVDTIDNDTRQVLDLQLNTLLQRLADLGKSTQDSSGNPFPEPLNTAQEKLMRVSLKGVKSELDDLREAFFPKRA